MFPTTGLFQKLLCPDYTTCRLQPCLYSHTPATAIPGVRQSQPAASSSSSSVPQKRPATAAAPDAGPSKTSRNAYTAKPNTQGAPGTNAGGSSAPKASGSGANARPPPNASASSANLSKVDMGPPRLTMTGNTHTPFLARQKLLIMIYDQLLITYASLPDQLRARNLANQHAKIQEATLYARSNKSSYRQGVISALGRLKKRPLALTEADTGTLEDDLEREKARTEEEKGRLTRARIARYVSSKELLAKYDYMVEVPPGPGGDRPTEEGNLRKCERCKEEFTVRRELDQVDRQKCHFHYGRMVTEVLGGVKQRVYSCCPAVAALEIPCQIGPHVFRDEEITQLHSRVGFVTTSSLGATAPPTAPAKLDVVALDCELVYTTSGMALARLTVVGHDGQVVLDAHVKPQGALLDTNVRFSGVYEKDLETATLDVAGVREALGKLVGPETIIVGHGLENDLKALRIVHHNVIDTAIIFPHPRGVPFRHALRNLTRDHLGKFIQEGGSKHGHSAVEDSLAALELLRWRMKQDNLAGR
ncbi:hypothetical protein RQP46_006475 [Phenoliferia psychrophenolica]